MNIIFLDFDEVMNSVFFKNTSKEYVQAEKNADMRMFEDENKNNPKFIDMYIALKASEVDPEAMKLLNLIVERSEAKVVICSSWRYQDPFKSEGKDETVKRFKELFKKLGYSDFPVIGFTDYIGHRGYEVAQYLDELNLSFKIDNYLVIDDGRDYFVENYNDLSDEDIVSLFLINNNPSNKVFKNPEDYRNKSRFWKNQPLLRTNPLTGLTRQDTMLAIEHFSPRDLLSEARREYVNYEEKYGIFNPAEVIVKEKSRKLRP